MYSLKAMITAAIFIAASVFGGSAISLVSDSQVNSSAKATAAPVDASVIGNAQSANGIAVGFKIPAITKPVVRSQTSTNANLNAATSSTVHTNTDTKVNASTNAATSAGTNVSQNTAAQVSSQDGNAGNTQANAAVNANAQGWLVVSPLLNKLGVNLSSSLSAQTK